VANETERREGCDRPQPDRRQFRSDPARWHGVVHGYHQFYRRSFSHARDSAQTSITWGTISGRLPKVALK
jgi:hypothetical protein